MASRTVERKLSERIAHYEDRYLDCRTRRHVYEDIEDDGRLLKKWQESNTVARLVQRCERCATVHYEAWNRITGDLLDSSYVYPADYSIEGGKETGFKKKLRREYLQR